MAKTLFFTLLLLYLSVCAAAQTDRGTLMAIKFQNKIFKKINLFADLAYDYFKRDFTTNQDVSTILILSGERIMGNLKLNYTCFRR